MTEVVAEIKETADEIAETGSTEAEAEYGYDDSYALIDQFISDFNNAYDEQITDVVLGDGIYDTEGIKSGKIGDASIRFYNSFEGDDYSGGFGIELDVPYKDGDISPEIYDLTEKIIKVLDPNLSDDQIQAQLDVIKNDASGNINILQNYTDLGTVWINTFIKNIEDEGVEPKVSEIQLGTRAYHLR